MNDNRSIIPECYVDSCLTEVLLNAGKSHVNHQKGNGTVAKKMKEDFNDSFCVGIIDEDRRPLAYLTEFDLKKQSAALKLWKHKTKHHYLIQVCPVIEQMITKECLVKNIELVDFNLPSEVRDLMKESKSVSSKNDIRFIELFKRMLSEECDSFIVLRRWLQYLKQKKYQTDINEL
jgi:hypothetical protein